MTFLNVYFFFLLTNAFKLQYMQVNTTLSDETTDSHTAALLFNSTAALADYSTADAEDSQQLVASAEIYIELTSLLVKSFNNYTIEEATDVVAVRSCVKRVLQRLTSA